MMRPCAPSTEESPPIGTAGIPSMHTLYSLWCPYMEIPIPQRPQYSIVPGHVRQMRLLGFCYSTCTSWVSGLFQGLVIKISSYSMYMYLPKQHTMYMYMCMTYVQTFLKTFLKKLRSNTPHLPCPHIHAYMVAFENMCEIHVRENEENVKKVRPGNMSHKRVDMR